MATHDDIGGDPLEELSFNHVRRRILHCSKAELERRMRNGLTFIQRNGRTYFTRMAIARYQRTAERRRLPDAARRLKDDDDYRRPV